MRLKYSMRGVGCGILFTMFIFLVIIIPDRDLNGKMESEKTEVQNEKNGLEKLLGVQESSADDNKNSVDSESTGTDGENSANDAEEVNSDETAQTDKPEKTEE